MQVFAIGVDIERISRFKNVNKRFLNKIYTKIELQYCLKRNNPAQQLAARFAGKEAIIKAFYDLGKILSFRDIEIVNDKNNIPTVNIPLKNYKTKISLSHNKDNAIAFALVIK